MTRQKRKILIGDVIGDILAVLIFIVPFYFMFVTSLKSKKEANLLRITFPAHIHWENFRKVIQADNYMLIRAFKNSALITLFSVILLIVVGSMAGYVIQRRNDKTVKIFSTLFMLGLMIPASILPTIYLLQTMHIYKTLFSIVMIEVALSTPFTIMLYRGFMSSIPVELEEATRLDGCTRLQVFTRVVFPLLKPINATVIILNAVSIFNDFTNPLYFFPGEKNATVQLTLYNYMGVFSSEYNLMFADVVLITIPMLVLFLIFNKKIIAGMVAGSVKA